MRRNRLYMAAPDTLLEPLADRSEGAETLGAFRSVAAGNGLLPGTMDCTYDKVSYRPRACNVLLRGMAAPLKVSYAAWDDPANAVEAPPGVAEPSPLPKASGAPMATTVCPRRKLNSCGKGINGRPFSSILIKARSA